METGNIEGILIIHNRITSYMQTKGIPSVTSQKKLQERLQKNATAEQIQASEPITRTYFETLHGTPTSQRKRQEIETSCLWTLKKYQYQGKLQDPTALRPHTAHPQPQAK